MTEEQKQKIIELYPTHSASEIGKMIGLNKSRINCFANKQGIKHTEGTLERMKHERVVKSIAAHKKKSWEKAAEKRRRTYKMEMLRLLSGQEKQTKIIVSVLSRKCRRRMIMLCNTFNYFRDEDINKAVVYYDKETRRSARAEKYAKEKYGINFVEADG